MISRATIYARRARRGLSVLQQLGRLGLFRLETRVSFAKLDYEAEEIYLYMDSKYAPMRVRSCAKEPWTVEWLEQCLAPGDVLYDIGANVGAYSLVAAKIHGGDIEVVAFEPAYATFTSLCENIVLNDVSRAVFPLQVVLGSSTELGGSNYRDLEAGAGLHSTGDRAFLKGAFAPLYRQQVLTYRLDDLLAQFPLPRPNHLKIDVDGAELDILQGGAKTLRSESLRTVMIEVNESESEALTAALAEYGLHLRTRYDPVSTHGHWYGLFERRGAPE
ncbi:MAG: FkbM family methyltransferase [Gaiellaceae bacterium]